MQPTANGDLSDLDKVLNALSFITDIRSPNDLFEVFGLDTLPTAQKYGIVFGILTFTLTVTTVMALLILGGSFKRIAEQAEGGSTIPCAIEERLNRPLLLERLLESQERMMKNYPTETFSEGLTKLTKMLMNIAPDVQKAQESMAALVAEDGGEKGKKELEKKKEELKKYIPEGYEANYVKAYRKCQDKPGGKLSYFISKPFNNNFFYDAKDC
jgi:hypothetical protein